MDARVVAGQRAPNDTLPAQRTSLAVAEQIRQYARELAGQAPPLTAQQRSRLAGLLRGVGAMPVDTRGGVA